MWDRDDVQRVSCEDSEGHLVVIDDLLNLAVVVSDDEANAVGRDGFDVREKHRRLLGELPAQTCGEQSHEESIPLMRVASSESGLRLQYRSSH